MSIEPAVSSEVEEWLADLEALYAQMTEWLGEMDPPPTSRGVR